MITVVGMGKLGLPLAVQFASKGHKVIGTDIDSHAVNLINSGVEPFPGEYDLQQLLAKAVAENRLRASLDTQKAVSESEAVIIVVPLLLDDQSAPDFSALDSATSAVAKGLKAGSLVSYETTLPVGATRDRFVPMLEAGSGLVAGLDFFVVFSPERLTTGRVFADLRKYPKLVGGINVESERRGLHFYGQVLDFDERLDLPKPNGVWGLGSTEAAELAKLAETTYRDVNIAFANQLATFAEKSGIDFLSIIESCNSQPFSHIHSPGIAVGGHCIPVYPHLYLWNDPDATIVRSARQVNEGVPERVVARIEEELGSITGLRVAILGAAYRGGTKETALSGVFSVTSSLESRGAQVFVHDPLYSDGELQELGFVPFHRGEATDIVIIQADHEEYQEWTNIDVPEVRLVMDGRSISTLEKWNDILFLSMGQPSQHLGQVSN